MESSNSARCLVSALALVAACSGPRWRATDDVAHTAPLDVRLERRVAGGAGGPFAHPADVPAGPLAVALDDLRTTTDDGDAPLFGGEDTRGLAKALAEGLARADSEERVRFSRDRKVARERFPRWLTTRGVAFVQPAGTLNLVFESLDEELDFQEEGDWREPTVWAEGRRLALPAEGGSELGLAPGPHPAWCTLRVDALARAAADAPAVEPPPTQRERELLVRQLHRLRAEGVLTDEELARELRALGEDPDQY